MKNVLGIHGSHDASFTFIDKNGKLRVIEVRTHSQKKICLVYGTCTTYSGTKFFY